MPSVRIRTTTLEVLRELARKEGQPMTTVLERAIEGYRRDKFLEEANAAYAALKANPGKWREELAERKHWN